MRSETITVGSIKAEVRSKSRRTLIVEAMYKQALLKAHPEIADYERALYAITATLPFDDRGVLVPHDKRTPEQEAAVLEYNRAVIAVDNQFPVGKAYADEATRFVPLLARITKLTRAPFKLDANGLFVYDEVVAAFEDWIDADDEEPDGFWAQVRRAVHEIDAPLTPVEERPPETLTEAEQADPLPTAPDEVGSDG